MPDVPRFSFHPLERRGLLLGLQAGQLVTVGAGTAVAVVIHGAAPGAAGNALAFLAVTVSVAAAVWTRHGRTVASWAVLGMAWLQRGGRRTRLSRAPLAGTAGPETHAPVSGRSPRRRPGHPDRLACVTSLPGGIEVTEQEVVAAGDRFGVVRDRQALSWVAVLPVRGPSFALLDPDEQIQRLESWRTVLAAVARPGSPVVRVQWVQRSGPAGAQGGADPVAAPGPGDDTVAGAAASYRELVEQVVPAAQYHQTWMALAVGGDRRSRSAGGAEVLGRESRFLQGQLRQAGLEPGEPLSRAALISLLGGEAMASRESWSDLQIDGALHATYWVAEWPRVEVGPDFMLPLLMGKGRRAVSLVMAPVPADRALREVRSARTADLADAQLRSRAGFLSSARRDREAEGVARREQELADGHAEYRFSAYVSVSAPDRGTLASACSELEQAAQAARLEVRRLYGRQAEAYVWTLPVGRGLR